MEDAEIEDAPVETSRVQAGAPLALYRRYRPDTFAEVIGQDHVTEPLQRALANNRVNHAYLFSGPRGCGKTTSARILARALNCEQGPVAEPCGVCDSCRDLATGGPGSIDVIEIDAASHGGVDDARDLRERAFFAPVSSRYKVYIVDEAHMVTPAGFNALLKLVEEPPPHVKFIFATTEPDKVIGTIRSRTHHYPFRLVPPRTLGAYLGKLCDQEGIEVEAAVLPLVVRAGAGSVRDSLSVLDQLLGGAAETGVSYQQATALLGYTPDSLLDEFLDAFAAGDAGGVFSCIDKVIEVGQDPRRFGEDLLRRLRDLVIVAAVPDALSTGLVDVADDQGERLTSQAATLGAGELTRAAEVIAKGLTDMRGTTAPRLHLELMCSRVLLPGSDVDERGIHARLDRLERRIGMSGTGAMESDAPRLVGQSPVAPAAPTPGEQAAPVHPTQARPAEMPSATGPASAADQSGVGQSGAGQAGAGQVGAGRDDTGQAGGFSAGAAPSGPAQSAPPSPQQDSPAQGVPASSAPVVSAPPQGASPQGAPPQGAPAQGAPAQSAPAPEAPAQGAPAAAKGQGSLTVTDVRRLWPEVLEEVKNRRRFTWILLSQNAHVADIANGTLVLAMPNVGARDSFSKGGSEDILREALVVVLGADLRIDAMVESGAGQAGVGPADPASTGGGAPGSGGQGPSQGGAPGFGADPASAAAASWNEAPAAAGPSGQNTDPGPAATEPPNDPPPPPWDTGEPAQAAQPPRPDGGAPPAGPSSPVDPALKESLRQSIRPTRSGPPAAEGVDARDAEVDRNDSNLEESAESHTELLARHLGAEIIAEEEDRA